MHAYMHGRCKVGGHANTGHVLKLQFVKHKCGTRQYSGFARSTNALMSGLQSGFNMSAAGLTIMVFTQMMQDGS